MLRPTPEQLGVLAPFERVAFEVADTVNRVPWMKRSAHLFLRTIAREWIGRCTGNLVHVEGIEHMAGLNPDRGVFLAVNHRSFFDLYVISSVLLRKTSWIEQMFFPVRSSYFYERPDGVLVNAAMSALAMYPPIMREGPKKSFNQYATAVLSERLAKPGTLVGYHPEGTRGRGEDPYALLPFGAGTGSIIHAARPIVIPAFTLGLSNDIAAQIRGNFNGTGAPITMVFGAPIALDDLLLRDASPETFRAIADRTREGITALMPIERALRERNGLPSLVPNSAVPTVGPESRVMPPSRVRGSSLH